MRRVAVFIALVVVLLAVPLGAPAEHASAHCQGGAPVVSNMVGKSCAIVLRCPDGTQLCRWLVELDASGVGEVEGRVVNDETGLPIASCGSELISCTATTLLTLPPTRVLTLTCSVFGGEHLPALLASLDCSFSNAPGHPTG